MLTPAYSVAWKSTIRRSQSMPADWPCLVYALFMPCLYLVYALFMPSMWVWCDMRSSHVMPTLACALAGFCGCGIQESAHLNMKTRHCISGWGRAVLSGLGLTHCHRLRPADNTRDNCSDFYRLLSNLYTSFMVTKFSSTHCIRSSLSQHFMSMVLAKSIAEEE